MSAIVILLISYAIVLFITKTALNTEKDKKLITILKRWVVATVIFAVLIFSSIYFKNIIVIVPLWQAAISVLFIFIFGKMVSKKDLMKYYIFENLLIYRPFFLPPHAWHKDRLLIIFLNMMRSPEFF